MGVRNVEAGGIKDISKNRADADRIRKGAALASIKGTVNLSGTQVHMLSYLNAAQIKQWNSFSPVKQRKLLEEVERRVEIRINQSEMSEPKESRVPRSDQRVAWETEMPSHSHNRGHPDQTIVRQILPVNIRSRRTVVRSTTEKEETLRTVGSGKTPEKVKSYKRFRQTENGARDAADVRQQTKNRDLLRKPGEASMISNADKNTKAILPAERMDQRKENLQIVPAFAVMEAGRRGKRKLSAEEARAQRKQGISVRAAEKSPEIKSGIGYWTLERRRTAQQEDALREGIPGVPLVESLTLQNKLQRQTVTRDRNTRRGDSKETVRYRDETKKEISTNQSGKALPKREEIPDVIEKENVSDAALPMKRSGENTEMLLVPTVQREKRDIVIAHQERREVLLRSGQEDHLPEIPSQTRTHKERPEKKARGRQEKKKRETKFQKLYVAELIRVIERDARKDENMKQAQKTGQISASIAELTGQTARSTVRTAALPMRVALNVLAKRLRAEIKKRLKEAAAAIGKYAVLFGGPVLVVALIVMLLSGICMSFISEEEGGVAGSGLGYQIVEEAKKHIGLPYVWGGTSLETGCDCSGFVWAVYNKFGYNLPRTAGDQYRYGRKVSNDVSEWQLGDLVYYSRTGTVQSGGGRLEHIVIYIGNGQVISCGPVQIHDWNYRSDYYGACRIIPDEAYGDFSGGTNEEICWNYFRSQGFSKAATAGILGNIYVETGGTFDPGMHQYGGGPGRGICQWEESYSGGSGRYNNLVAFANGIGKSWDDITAQLQFVSYELNTGQMNPYFSKFGGVTTFKNLTDAATAAYVFLCGFEYCGDPGRAFLESKFALSLRESHARWAYQNYS